MQKNTNLFNVQCSHGKVSSTADLLKEILILIWPRFCLLSGQCRFSRCNDFNTDC